MQLSNYLCWSFRDFLQRIIISKDFKPHGPWSLSKQLRSWQGQLCTKGLALAITPLGPCPSISEGRKEAATVTVTKQ